jgi:hypothetical protein
MQDESVPIREQQPVRLGPVGQFPRPVLRGQSLSMPAPHQRMRPKQRQRKRFHHDANSKDAALDFGRNDEVASCTRQQPTVYSRPVTRPSSRSVSTVRRAMGPAVAPPEPACSSTTAKAYLGRSAGTYPANQA